MKWYFFYFFFINCLAVFLTVLDKVRAVRGGWRVRESTLLLVAVLGGGPAMLLTMLIAHHKVHRPKFMVGIPVIMLVQIAAVIVWRRF